MQTVLQSMPWIKEDFKRVIQNIDLKPREPRREPFLLISVQPKELGALVSDSKRMEKLGQLHKIQHKHVKMIIADLILMGTSIHDGRSRPSVVIREWPFNVPVTPKWRTDVIRIFKDVGVQVHTTWIVYPSIV